MTHGAPKRLGHRSSAGSLGIVAIAVVFAFGVIIWTIASIGLSSPYSPPAPHRAWAAVRYLGSGLGPSLQVLLPLVVTVILGFYLAVVGGQIGTLYSTLDVVLLQQRLKLAADVAVVVVGSLTTLRCLALIGCPNWVGRVIGLGAELLVAVLLSIELGSQLLLSDELRRRSAERRLGHLRNALAAVERRTRALRRDRSTRTLLVGPALIGSVGPLVLALLLFDANLIVAGWTWGITFVAQLFFMIGYGISASDHSRRVAIAACVPPVFALFLIVLLASRFFELGEMSASILFSAVGVALLLCNAAPLRNRFPELSYNAIVLVSERRRIGRAIDRIAGRLTPLSDDERDAQLRAALQRGIGSAPERG